jgi:uncharacterized protein (DUF2249 family)
MKISAQTKIAQLIKTNPACIDEIASINKHFEKLRNPLLRTLLASRVSISDAAKIGGCSVEDIFNKLSSLGFESDTVVLEKPKSEENPKQIPEFMNSIQTEHTVTLDVRESLAQGKDPFDQIMGSVNSLMPGQCLKIVNTFEPLPLINVLKKKGFEHYTLEKPAGEFHVYFNKMDKVEIKETLHVSENSIDNQDVFHSVMNQFNGQLKTIDVRALEMPLPMITILNEIKKMEDNQALYVQHKKVPHFLLPELKDSGFSYLIKEDGEGDVKLLIYK